MEKIPWSKLRVKDLQRFQKEFLEKGIVRPVDGDKQTIS